MLRCNPFRSFNHRSQTHFSRASPPLVSRFPAFVCLKRRMLSLSPQLNDAGTALQVYRFRTAYPQPSIARQATQLWSLSQRITLRGQHGYPGQIRGFNTYVEPGHFSASRNGKRVLRWAFIILCCALMYLVYHYPMSRPLQGLNPQNADISTQSDVSWDYPTLESIGLSHLIHQAINEAMFITAQIRHLQEAYGHKTCDCSSLPVKEMEHRLASLGIEKRNLIGRLKPLGIIWEQTPRAVLNERGSWIDNRFTIEIELNGELRKVEVTWDSRTGLKEIPIGGEEAGVAENKTMWTRLN